MPKPGGKGIIGRGRVALLAAALSLCLLIGLTSNPARAEAFAVRVILSHVPTLSNWGPAEANGVVLITLSEGDVRADLVGLPPLPDHERYQLWLKHSTTEETFPLARFNAAPEGEITYVDQELPEPIPDRGWDLVLISVEPEPDQGSQTPDARWALVGGFAGTPAEATLIPTALPETGAMANDAARTASLLLPLNLGILLLLGLIRRGARHRRAGGTTAALEER